MPRFPAIVAASVCDLLKLRTPLAHSLSCHAQASSIAHLSDVASKLSTDGRQLSIGKDELEGALPLHRPHVHVYHGVGQLHHLHRNLALSHTGKFFLTFVEVLSNVLRVRKVYMSFGTQVGPDAISVLKREKKILMFQARL